jgi:hypothetical protein
MSAASEPLSRKQAQTIAALLACPTLAQAAQQGGIAEATLHRWLKEEAFQQAYRDARRYVVQQAIVQVQQATGEAVTTLRTVMQDPASTSSAKVSAARTILETALRAVELEDIEQRLAALEAQTKEDTHA